MAARLFHRTAKENAEKILKKGFCNTTDYYMFETPAPLSGVWLSNIPLGCMEGTHGDTLLEVIVDMTVEELFNNEVVEEGRFFREFFIDADLLNAKSQVRLLNAEEEDNLFTDDEPWSDYPAGEPEKTYKLRETENEEV